MAPKRSPIILDELGFPTLKGQPLAEGEWLEIRSGGKWQRVFLARSKDRVRQWVLRFEDNPDLTMLAAKTLARRRVR